VALVPVTGSVVVKDQTLERISPHRIFSEPLLVFLLSSGIGAALAFALALSVGNLDMLSEGPRFVLADSPISDRKTGVEGDPAKAVDHVDVVRY
jgi:hypothetical protein